LRAAIESVAKGFFAGNAIRQHRLLSRARWRGAHHG
jgi:hypothetical protein